MKSLRKSGSDKKLGSEPEAENAAEQEEKRKGERFVSETLEALVGLADRAVGRAAAAEEQERGHEGQFVGNRRRRFSGDVDPP